jgi:hypothetical protein
MYQLFLTKSTGCLQSRLWGSIEDLERTTGFILSVSDAQKALHICSLCDGIPQVAGNAGSVITVALATKYDIRMMISCILMWHFLQDMTFLGFSYKHPYLHSFDMVRLRLYNTLCTW